MGSAGRSPGSDFAMMYGPQTWMARSRGVLPASIPISFRVCAALGATWFTIQILTSYPSLFLMFCYPVMLAAILEPMKVSLWRFFWLCSLAIVATIQRVIRKFNARYAQAQDPNKGRSSASGSSNHQTVAESGAVAPEEVEDSIDADYMAILQNAAEESMAMEEADGMTMRMRKSAIYKVAAGLPQGNCTSWCTTTLSATALWYAELLMKKLLLVISILLCLLTAGRVLVILGQIIIHTAEQIAHDFPHYERGAQHRIQGLRDWLAALTEAKFGKRIEVSVDVLMIAEQQILGYANTFALSISQYMVQQVVPQTCITTLFLVFLLWNPVKAEGQRKEILELCSDYVKVKSMLSTILGFLVGLSLHLCGLELYYAAALLVAVANFIPNGALLCSVFPCIFALVDDRKKLGQVLWALIVEIVLINSFAFIVEPLFFGAAIEMHPIPAILGVTFFGYVWGMPGMLISIPILGACRLALAAFSNSKAPDDERAAMKAMQDFIEGHWTAAATLDVEQHEAWPYEEADMEDGFDGEDENMRKGYGHSTQVVDEQEAQVEEEQVASQDGPIMASIRAKSECVRVTYRERKVWIDGLLYLILVYFLFSSLSDRVFGIYGAPPGSSSEELRPISVANGSIVVGMSNQTDS